MQITKLGRWAGILGVLTASPCRPMAEHRSVLEITVHVDDYSGIEPAAMAQAQGFAGKILGRAGIGVQWRSCLNPKQGAMPTTDCRSEATDLTHLLVKVLPERMCRRLAFTAEQVGLAALGGKGGVATDAYVCFDRVMNLANEWMTPWPPVLGAMIAHEAGHLLLGVNGHSPVGIMRARWSLGDIKQILEGRMNFDRQQAEKMRGDVRRRVNARNVVPKAERSVGPPDLN
jgi:hypothetical protein